MEKVNIYIRTSNKSPQKRNGYGCYIMECFRNGEPRTVEEIIELKDATAMQAEMLITLYALRRLNCGCELTIYQPGWLARVFDEEWINKWAGNNWTAASGKAVGYKDEWLELYQRLLHNKYEFKTGNHSYTDWMESKLKKEMERCLKNLENLTV